MSLFLSENISLFLRGTNHALKQYNIVFAGHVRLTLLAT